MTEIPRTMTLAGLGFLQALASYKKDGVFLEVGPLFGSSTDAISKGRTTNDEIHTIDTFEPAPWVKRRLGIDLGRKLFDKFTSHIDNLVVHEGFAPDIVEDSWNKEIGFYFDDATHGDPGWTNNFDFFKKFFNNDTIVCGDDFASGWPDIVRNVYQIADDWNVKLFVIGRVWAIARNEEARIEGAIDKVFPILKDVSITTRHGTLEKSNKAAVWSWGLHQPAPLTEMRIQGPESIDGQVVTFKKGQIRQTTKFDSEFVDLSDIDQLYISSSTKSKVQYCMVDSSGSTANSKAIRTGQIFNVPSNSKIVALRLSD